MHLYFFFFQGQSGPQPPITNLPLAVGGRPDRKRQDEPNPVIDGISVMESVAEPETAVEQLQEATTALARAMEAAQAQERLRQQEIAMVERVTAAALAEMTRRKAAQMAEDDEVLMLL